LGPDRVRIRLCFHPDGVIQSAIAEGHAGTDPGGSNVACAAVTVLLRTAYETVAGYDGVTVSGRAPAPGFLSFQVGRYPPGTVDRLKGVSDFLVVGLSGVQRDYPGLIDLNIES
jgi:uncharacterized protein YsxB (DUF464 family)